MKSLKKHMRNKFCHKTKARNLQLKTMQYKYLQKWQGFSIKSQPFYNENQIIYRTLHQANCG